MKYDTLFKYKATNILEGSLSNCLTTETRDPSRAYIALLIRTYIVVGGNKSVYRHNNPNCYVHYR